MLYFLTDSLRAVYEKRYFNYRRWRCRAYVRDRSSKRGRQVVVIDHANKAGKKILMSGGGRCNFTNYYVEPTRFLSQNTHFCKSALSRYTQWDFITLVDKYHLQYHEKTLGQLFCDGKSSEIVEILLAECKKHAVEIKLNTKVNKIEKIGSGDNQFSANFKITTPGGDYIVESLVIATGGLSIPTMGATDFGYKIAKQFGLNVLNTHPGLVPFALSEKDKNHFSALSGVSLFVEVKCNNQSFRENLLFTHRGLSGPAMLQISSFWQPGDLLEINMLPKLHTLTEHLTHMQQVLGNSKLKTILDQLLPRRLVALWIEKELLNTKLAELATKKIYEIAILLQHWKIKPCGTEGYRTAEVTQGGVCCNGLSSKTFEAKKVKNLYFVGEVIDVTGWLGGYNFQWAWSSGWAAGQTV